jgi:hypothetical protein
MAEVIGLRGGRVLAPVSEPAENVVARCEELLAQARSGDLRGLLVARVVRPGVAQFVWSHDDDLLTWHGLSSALLGLMQAWSADPEVEDIKEDGAS